MKTKPLNMDVILKNIDKYAKEFSEGDESLEKVLKLLWTNGFETIGCCRGHDNKKSYIGLNIKDEDKIIKLLSSLDKNNIIITFNSSNKYYNCSIKSYEENNNAIFKNILDSFSKENIDDNIKSIIEEIKNRKSSDVLNIWLYYKNGKEPNEYRNTMDKELIEEYKKKYELTKESNGLYFFTVSRS